jgi:hypothetical protein
MAQENHLKRLTRERRLLPHSRFQAAFKAAAKQSGQGPRNVSPRTIDRWLGGQSTPRPDAQDVLEEMFGEPIEKLLEVAPEVSDVVTESSPGQITDAINESGAGLVEDACGPRDSKPASRRVVSALVRELMMVAAEQSRDYAELADVALGSYVMEQLEVDVVQLARDYMRRPPIPLFEDIVRARRHVFIKLDQTRRPHQIRDLHFLAGVLSGLLAQMCIDVGQWRHAADHALAAWTYANTIGHDGLAGWARGMQATVAFWDDRPRDAVLAIRRGQEHIASGPLAVRLHSLAARAWSHGGNVDHTIRSVRAAEGARDCSSNQVDDLHDSIGGLFRWDTTRQEMCASSAFLQLLCFREDLEPTRIRWLADQVVQHAQRALAASRTNQDTRSVTLETSMSLDMATAYLVLGDAERVQETLVDVFSLPAEHRTYPLLYRLGHLQSRLIQISSRWTHDLGEQIDDFRAAAIPPKVARALPPSS